MHKDWHSIWNKKNRIEKYILEALIKANGFEHSIQEPLYENWIQYHASLIEQLHIQDHQSVYEVGCGSGAFLYPLYTAGYPIGGADTSPNLIDLANRLMTGNFACLEATHIDTRQTYDIVLCHSVFQYFENLDYAQKVLTAMIKKATKTIAILDINDISKRHIYHKTRLQNRTKTTHPYKHPPHMMYEKSYFIDTAQEHELKVKIFEHREGISYTNASLRFHAVFWRE